MNPVNGIPIPLDALIRDTNATSPTEYRGTKRSASGEHHDSFRSREPPRGPRRNSVDHQDGNRRERDGRAPPSGPRGNFAGRGGDRGGRDGGRGVGSSQGQRNSRDGPPREYRDRDAPREFKESKEIAEPPQKEKELCRDYHSTFPSSSCLVLFVNHRIFTLQLEAIVLVETSANSSTALKRSFLPSRCLTLWARTLLLFK